MFGWFRRRITGEGAGPTPEKGSQTAGGATPPLAARCREGFDCSNGYCRAAEALAAYECALFEKVNPQFGDVIVVRVDGPLNDRMRQIFATQLHNVFPMNKVVVVRGMSITARSGSRS